MTATLDLLERLIACRSVTPDDAQCQDLIVARLRALGFACETMMHGPDSFRVTNLWAKRAPLDARRPPAATKTMVFAGHTDVVPTGPVQAWTHEPFTPTHAGGKLYGRGTSDMKTSLAAMVVACEEFIASTPDTPLTLAFLLTSDEEGPAVDGTVRVVETLRARGERLDCCIVGEPTSVEHVGDMIKNGRRGTLSGRLTVRGIQGHVAYPQLARNPIHQLAPVLARLVAERWDEGNAHFPPTTWQVSNIHAGTGAGNVIPGEVVVDFNFRFSTASTAEALKARVHALLDEAQLDYRLDWTLGGEPFLCASGAFVEVVREAIRAEAGIETELSTTGGTSDGRFIATLCPETLELGPPNATIHKVDEHVAVADIEPLKNIYRRVLEGLHQRLVASDAA